MLNSVTLAGRLTKDPELKYTASGVAVVTFTLATDRDYKVNEEYPTDFLNCVAWRQTAETIANFLKKGSFIAIEGTLESRTYESDNRRVYVTEVNVQQFHFLEKKESSTPRADAPQKNQTTRYNTGRR
jgi:single-strand DNA-binding protein